MSRLLKPVYLHRPDHMLRRLATTGTEGGDVVSLPWGMSIEVDCSDLLGRGIARRGVHELVVSEAMWRLADRTDLALDVGANVGYFTALLSARCRLVRAFEPHPAMRRRLERNAARWTDNIVVDGRAVSDRPGWATLNVPPEFGENSGVPTLEPTDGGADQVEVETVRLDDVIAGAPLGVLKLDIEGHELAALRGAATSLDAGLIRDVVFEEYRAFPTPVSELLCGAGFEIFGLEEHVRGVDLVAPSSAVAGWDAPTFLATREPERAARRMRPRGWHCLRPWRSAATPSG